MSPAPREFPPARQDSYVHEGRPGRSERWWKGGKKSWHISGITTTKNRPRCGKSTPGSSRQFCLCHTHSRARNGLPGFSARRSRQRPPRQRVNSSANSMLLTRSSHASAGPCLLLFRSSRPSAFLASGSLTGANPWIKPIKFSISFSTFAYTVSLLLTALRISEWQLKLARRVIAGSVALEIASLGGRHGAPHTLWQAIGGWMALWPR